MLGSTEVNGDTHMSTNATRLMSLREMETALANGSASKNEVLATLTARLSSANIA